MDLLTKHLVFFHINLAWRVNSFQQQVQNYPVWSLMVQWTEVFQCQLYRAKNIVIKIDYEDIFFDQQLDIMNLITLKWNWKTTL